MAARHDLVLDLLCLGQHRVDPAVALAEVRIAPPADSGTLLAAAAALAAGEPGRARRELATVGKDGDPDQVLPALQLAAEVLDRNWFPGGVGAVLDGPEVAALTAAEDAVPVPARGTPVGLLAARMLPAQLTLRVSVEPGLGSSLAPLLAEELARFAEFAPAAAALGPPFAAHHALTLADLAVRAGLTGQAVEPLRAAATLAANDPAVQAAVQLVRGDWIAEPAGQPESLGLAITTPPYRQQRPGGDLDAAARHYAAAADAWASVGSHGGLAAVALRQAHLARLAGDRVGRDEHLALAAEHARRAGTGALTALCRIHAVLDRIGDGAEVPAAELDPIAGWVRVDGSRSFGRGLVRLLTARAARWRDNGDFVPARRALRLADHLAAATGGRLERPLVSAQVAELYGGSMYRRAQVVLADLDLANEVPALAPDAPGGTVRWVGAVHRALQLFQGANAARSADLVEAAAGWLRHLLGVASAGGPRSTVVTAIGPQVEADLVQSQVLVPWYRGQLRLRQGDTDGAAAEFGSALEIAERTGQEILRCLLLIAAGRRQEAVAIADELVRAQAVDLDLAVTLFVRLRAPELAAAALAALDAHGGAVGTRPWEDPARRADLHGLLGNHDEQVRLADEAVRRFEQWQARLTRDVLRTAATDDPVVAGAYHALILGHLALRTGPADDHRSLAALAAADRARGLSAVLLSDLGALDAEGRRAARSWLRAGSRWAAVYEDLARSLHPGWQRRPPELVRAELATAEARLDDAEHEVAVTAPALLRGRVALPADLVAARRTLPEGAALLAWWTFDEELVAWAVTAEGVRVDVGAIRAPELLGLAARWRSGLIRGNPDPADGVRLRELLLDPFEAELAHRRRVVAVPHRDLAALPLTALPWADDVLGKEVDISVLPAVSLLARPSIGRRPDPARGAVVVGHPAALSTAERPAASLPGTATEARAVAATLGIRDPLIGEAATRAAVLERLTGSGVIHLACHGTVEPDAPNRARLLLAGTDELTVGDLVGLDLTADVLVLSACNTGRGEATAAGDVVGLARAALVAGAAAAVVSLWPVDDQAGTLLMDSFHRHLADGVGVTAALAAAQREVRRLDQAGRQHAYDDLASEHGTGAAAPGAREIDPPAPHPRQGADVPFFWAPFISVGL